MNNVAQASTLITQLYPAVGQITSPYEPQPVKDLNKYATLKAVGKKLFTMSCQSSCHSSFDLIKWHITSFINKTSIINQGLPCII